MPDVATYSGGGQALGILLINLPCVLVYQGIVLAAPGNVWNDVSERHCLCVFVYLAVARFFFSSFIYTRLNQTRKTSL